MRKKKEKNYAQMGGICAKKGTFLEKNLCI